MLYIYGIDTIDFGNKNIQDCLHTALIGSMAEDGSGLDYTPCAGSQKLLRSFRKVTAS